MSPLRILLLHDSPNDGERIHEALSAGGVDFVARRVGSRDEFMAALGEGGPDVILAEYAGPAFDGPEVLRMARDRCPGVPFLFVAGPAGEEQAVEALRGGANDYVHKDRLEHLVPALGRAVQEAEDQARRERAEKALRQQAERLADDVRRRDEFIALLAHELRDPLAPITNALALLRPGEAPDPALREAGEVLERQVYHLTRLVDDLLDAFRIAHGRLTLRRERVDLARVVRQAAEGQRGLLDQAGLALAVEVPAGPLWVIGDAARLAQVVRNLVRRAAKSTERGRRVTVAVAADPAADRAVVRVRDGGAGPLAPGPAAPDGSPGGLGLALIKGLVELHGGQVGGAGDPAAADTELNFWLPRADESEAAGAAPPPAAGDAPLRVLIIEDNRDTARTMRALLRRGGHEVAVAHDGPQGVRAAQDALPDVVLCDLGLPGLDGFEVARTLRGDPATARAHLIAITGYGRDEDRRRCREVGFDLHLTKPVDPTELQRILGALPRTQSVS